ncbi:MAG: CPBP family intramembrane metalloprotease [Lachnospiraceae bacterium]|nr:CPBP family intramembrane metalloprotease [Lachnospiraceae bacterium]MCI9342300.1 CPBP family intramembrane metalloprotease [Lachnospiraceae bacterium]
MNAKKVNWIFLAMVLLNITLVVLLLVIYPVFQLGIVANLIVSQIIILVPALIGVLAGRENLIEFAGFRKFKISSALMTVLFTFLFMPLVTLINMISMCFVDNAVAAVSGEILDTPFFVIFTLMGILGPMSEELVCRGIVYHGYKRTGTMMQALLLSSMIFALMHMNFNQAAYAFAIGVAMVLLVEATGSIWSSILVHVTFNSQQVCLMYLVDYGEQQLQEAQEALTTDMMILAISVYLVIAAVTTSLAGCVLAWIAKNEKREDNLRAIWKTRKFKKEGKVITVPLLIAIVIVFFVMSLEVLLA